MKTTDKLLGYAVALTEFDYSIPQEFAGASATLRVPPGRYEIVRPMGAPHGCCYVRLSGVLVETIWAGTNYRRTTPNTEHESSAHVYDYQIAYAVMQGGTITSGKMAVSLVGHAARLAHFSWDGGSGTTARLVPVAA